MRRSPIRASSSRPSERAGRRSRVLGDLGIEGLEPRRAQGRPGHRGVRGRPMILLRCRSRCSYGASADRGAGALGSAHRGPSTGSMIIVGLWMRIDSSWAIGWPPGCRGWATGCLRPPSSPGWISAASGSATIPPGVLLERGKVALNPGQSFGPGGAGHVRLNFATSRAILTEAVEPNGRGGSQRAAVRVSRVAWGGPARRTAPGRTVTCRARPRHASTRCARRHCAGTGP